MNQITDHPGLKLTFEYDYGDGWEVALTLEQCEKREVSLAGNIMQSRNYSLHAIKLW